MKIIITHNTLDNESMLNNFIDNFETDFAEELENRKLNCKEEELAETTYHNCVLDIDSDKQSRAKFNALARDYKLALNAIKKAFDNADDYEEDRFELDMKVNDDCIEFYIDNELDTKIELLTDKQYFARTHTMKNYKLHFNISDDSITRYELLDLLFNYNIEVLADDESKDNYEFDFDFLVQCRQNDIEELVANFNNKAFCDDEESRENFNSSCEFEEA